MATPKTILLKGDGLYREKTAGGAITPGHLIMPNSSDQVVVNTGNVTNVYPLFAVEDESQGKTISDAYASGDLVTFIRPNPGSEIYALVPAAAAAIVIGDLLVSNGDGTLKKDTAPAVAANNVDRVIARALEAVNNSGGGTPARIKVEILR